MAKRLVVITETSMRMLSAEEQRVALLNLAVPSPIFRETDPIEAQLLLLLLLLRLSELRRVEGNRVVELVIKRKTEGILGF